MKLLTTPLLLSTLFSFAVLAEIDLSASSATTTAQTSSTTDAPEIELRQVNLVNPDAALTGIAGAGVVTNYYINSQIGPGVGTNVAVVYTQTFANVPDQWPSAQPGTIGMGGLKRREVEAVPTLIEEARVAQQTGYMMQPVVIEAVTSVVTVRVRRATRIVVVETVGVSPAGNGSIATNGTANAGKVTALGGVFSTAASFGFGSHAPLYSATGR